MLGAYSKYLSQLLEAHTDTGASPNKAVFRLLELMQLENSSKSLHISRLKIEDCLAICRGEAVPSAALRMLFNKAIHDVLHIPYEQIESAWRTQQVSDDTPALKEVSLDLTPEAARYLCLQKLFMMERNRHQLRQSDIAGVIGVNETTLSNAERDQGNNPIHSESHFQSHKSTIAYAKSDSDSARQLELAAHRFFYPEGLRTASALVKSVAAYYGLSVAALESELGIRKLARKLNPTSSDKLSIVDALKLHSYLAQAIPPLEHLGIDSALLERLFPNPLVKLKAGEQSFRDVLNTWAEVASGGDARDFAALVGQTNGKDYNPTSVSFWGAGAGLDAALSDIIKTLETNPNTKGVFPECRAAFLAAAQHTLEGRKYRDISSKILRCKTLGSLLEAVSVNATTQLTGAQIIGRLNQVHGSTYNIDDFEQWKVGLLPKDADYPKHMTDAIRSLVENASGAELSERACQHIARLAAGKPPYRNRTPARQL